MKYITNLTKIETDLKKIKNLKKTDTLLIFHKPNETSIPMSLLPLITEKGCKIEFEEMKVDKDISAEVYLAFKIGMLLGKNENEVVNASSDPIITGLFTTAKNISSTKKTRKRADKVMPGPETVCVTQGVTSNVDVKPVKPRKQKEPVISADESNKKPASRKKTEKDDEFDKQYDRLTQIIAELPKTDSFDPSGNIYGIITSVKTSIEQNISLEKAVKLSCSALIADNLYTAIKGKKKEITEIIKNLPDEI